MVTYESIYQKANALLYYIKQAQLTIRLDKVIASLEDIESDCLARVQEPEPEKSRPIKQIATTADTVTVLCEDGTLWCFDQSAQWREYPGVPAPAEKEVST